jgi:hypothetical protein
MNFRELLENINTPDDIEPDLDQAIIDAENAKKMKKLDNDLKARYKGKYRDVIIDIEDHYGKFYRMGKKNQKKVISKYLGN